MFYPHPDQYTDAFRSQFKRLERVAPGITYGEPLKMPKPAFFENETYGRSEEDIVEMNARLGHLDRLIADWRSGCQIPFHEGYVRQHEDPPARNLTQVRFDDVPLSVTYTELTTNPDLALTCRPGFRIKGFYLREVINQGRFAAEFTFVCDEPGWKTMARCGWGDAMEMGSRIAIGTIPIGETLDRALVPHVFEGDPSLVYDPALARAVGVTGAIVASATWANFVFTQLSAGPRFG